MNRQTIDDYYEDKRIASLEAWELVRAAREAGADRAEIARLEQRAIDAGDTGD